MNIRRDRKVLDIFSIINYYNLRNATRTNSLHSCNNWSIFCVMLLFHSARVQWNIFFRLEAPLLSIWQRKYEIKLLTDNFLVPWLLLNRIVSRNKICQRKKPPFMFGRDMGWTIDPIFNFQLISIKQRGLYNIYEGCPKIM